jgi:hypothetical protein
MRQVTGESGGIVPKDDPARKAWWRRAIPASPPLDGCLWMAYSKE